MAEQDESLAIIIEVVDKFSKPLSDLKRSLEGFEKGGDENAGRLKKQFDQLRESTQQVSRAIQSGVMPALAAFGITALSVSAAVTGMITALRGFASSTQLLNRLSRETGLSIDKMKEWEAVGRRFGVGADQMRGGFRKFYENARLLRLGLGNAQEFYSRGLGRELDEFKQIKDQGKAFDYVISTMDRIAEPAHKRAWLELHGLDPRLAEAEKDEREKLIAEYRKTAVASTKGGIDAAEGFEEMLHRIRDAWSNLQVRMAESGTLQALTDLLELFRKVLASPELGKGLNVVFQSLTSIMQEMTATATALGYHIEGETTAPATAVTIPTAPTPGGIIDRFMGPRSENWHPPRSPGRPLTASESLFGLGFKQLSKDDHQEAVKEGTSQGVVEGLKKMMFEGGGTSDPTSPSSFGGARLYKASLGGGGGGYSGGGRASGPGGGGGRGSSTGGTSSGDGSSSTAADQSDRPGQIHGTVSIDGQQYGYGSGGRGRGSIPYGDYSINIGKGDIGPVGRRIGSVATVGRLGGEIDDPKYPGRPREGIQIHPGSSEQLERLYTQGCFAVPRSQWPAFKRALLEKSKSGPLILHIGRDGRAEVLTRAEHEARQKPQAPATPAPPKISEPPPEVPREKLMDASLKSNQATKIEGAAKVRVDLNGFPRGTKTKTDSDGVFRDVELRRNRAPETEYA